jgi:hypothetical protein
MQRREARASARLQKAEQDMSGSSSFHAARAIGRCFNAHEDNLFGGGFGARAGCWRGDSSLHVLPDGISPARSACTGPIA